MRARASTHAQTRAHARTHTHTHARTHGKRMTVIVMLMGGADGAARACVCAYVWKGGGRVCLSVCARMRVRACACVRACAQEGSRGEGLLPLPLGGSVGRQQRRGVGRPVYLGHRPARQSGAAHRKCGGRISKALLSTVRIESAVERCKHSDELRVKQLYGRSDVSVITPPTGAGLAGPRTSG
jgi:hypothetical protein